MDAFTLDTSGAVDCRFPGSQFADDVRWTDLSPFVQGYVEALFASNDPMQWESTGSPAHTVAPAFWRLSPEALALILRDCADAEAGRSHRDMILAVSDHEKRLLGAGLWERSGLTPYLSDDGRVNLRETK